MINYLPSKLSLHPSLVSVHSHWGPKKSFIILIFFYSSFHAYSNIFPKQEKEIKNKCEMEWEKERDHNFMWHLTSCLLQPVKSISIIASNHNNGKKWFCWIIICTSDCYQISHKLDSLIWFLRETRSWWSDKLLLILCLSGLTSMIVITQGVIVFH